MYTAGWSEMEFATSFGEKPYTKTARRRVSQLKSGLENLAEFIHAKNILLFCLALFPLVRWNQENCWIYFSESVDFQNIKKKSKIISEI